MIGLTMAVFFCGVSVGMTVTYIIYETVKRKWRNKRW